MPGVEQAGVSLIEDGRLRTVAQTGPAVTRLDELQKESGEGPCLDAILDGHTYRTNDLGDDRRWPVFGAAASDLGVRSVLGYRLFTSGRTAGALNRYHAEKDAFDAAAVEIGELFAAHTAIALIASQEQAQLRTALGSRDVIGTAKGLVMQRHRCTDEVAFALLVETSQHQHETA
ncbi:GAF and ANTAR domain-containing protein [Amycolatopsis sp. lyj-84]|uniref:GAF and ANTAR domain-containing protein n=1 Tax=Amycolatopsis sp. lyj-84 TaxID=2789284 RepID=UPI0039795664